MKIKSVHIILGVIISISTLIGLIFNLDGRWAKADELKKVEMRLEQKIQQDRVEALQERMWKLEDRYCETNKMPQEVKDEYRKIKTEKELLEKHITEFIKQTKNSSSN
jgi:archaellum component FlaC